MTMLFEFSGVCERSNEEVDDLVVEVLLLERDEVLLAAIRSFHLIFVYFFGRNWPGVRVS